MRIEDTTTYEQSIEDMHPSKEPPLFVGLGELDSLQWAVASLTCEDAKKNTSGYACVSNNSRCLPVKSESGYIGYRCGCTSGFEGNPYMYNGCHGTPTEPPLSLSLIRTGA